MREEKNDPLITARCERAALLCALAVVILGISGLLGWGFDIAMLKSMAPGWATTKVNTSLAFVLVGVSLLAAGRRPGAGWAGVHLAAAAAATAIGLLTLGEHLFVVNLGIDQWLFAADPEPAGSMMPPGRMALATATGLSLTGLALLLLDSGRGRSWSAVAAMTGNLIGVLAVIGHAYGVTALYGIGAFTTVTVHSAVGLVVATLGVVLVRPRRGLMAVVTSNTVGGVMARSLLPFALIAPFLIGWLRLQGERQGYYGSEVGIALVTITYVALFSTFIWRTAAALRDSDLRRSAAERERQQQQIQLTGIIDSAMDAIIMIDAGQRITLFNAAAEAMFGYRAADVWGKPLDRLLPVRFRGTHAGHVTAFGATGTTSRRMGGLGAITGLRASGEEFPIEASISQSVAGGVKSYTVILRDITERQRIEADLRIAATAFDAQVGIMVTDAKGVILRINRAFTDDTGYTAEDMVGKTPRMLRSGRHDAAFFAALWDSIDRTGSWEGEIWDRHKDGEICPKWMIITAVKDPGGVVTHYVSSHTDISRRKAAEEEIRLLAFFDPLTRLPNRRLLVDRLHQALALSLRSGQHGALLFIDLDNFKTLNDTLGHDQGDLLLQQVANRLSESMREGDTVARLGGDEFVVLVENISERIEDAATHAELVAEKILETLNRPHRLGDHDYHSTPSIGITVFGDKPETLDGLLKQADLAMYQAKAAGRNGLRFYDPGMQAAVTAHVILERELRNGLRAGEFVLYYQGQVDADGGLGGAEALVRWEHPQHGMVLPNTFIPVAEDTGLIIPLGLWVLETACAQLAAWAGRAETAQLTLSVNISGRQLRQPDFVGEVLDVLERTGADPHKLKLELTESVLMDNMEDIIAKMNVLKAHGVGFALDDFGTGYSSLSYLKRLPLEKLKIDRSFVSDVLTDPNDAAIARTIVDLARNLGLSVIAEGVETEEQRVFLARNGSAAYQGYLFGQAMPLAEFEYQLRRTQEAGEAVRKD